MQVHAKEPFALEKVQPEAPMGLQAASLKAVKPHESKSPSVYNSPQVIEFVNLSRGREGNILLPWSEKGHLNSILVA